MSDIESAPTSNDENLPPPFWRVLGETEAGGWIIDFWVPEPTGDEEADLAYGHVAGAEVLSAARELGSPEIICHCVAAILDKGRFGSLEAGFFSKLIRAAYAGAAN